MPKSQLETFTDRHEAIALFDHLRGRDPQKPWPLLPILAFIAPGGSGKSTLIAYLRLQKCCLSEGRTALPYASLDFTLPHTPTDLLLILVSLRDQLQQHADGQEKHLTFPRFDLGALIAQATSSAEDLSSFGPQEVRRKLSTGKQAFEAASTLGSTLGHTLPFVPPLLAGLHLAGQIKPVRELLSYLEDSTGWKWYRMHSADTGLNANATMKDVLLRLHVLSMPGKPERDGLVNKLLPAAFIADLLDALVDTDPPRAWSKTANVVFFLDGFEALQRTSSTTATRLLQVLTTEQRKQATTDPFLLVIGSRDRLPGLSEAEQQPAFAQRTSAQDEQAAQKRIRELHTAWQQQLPGNRRFLRLKDLYLTLWLRDFGPDDTRSYLLKFGEREQTRAFTQNGLLVQTIDRATHGHPLYLALAAEAVLEANARGKTLHPDDFELADVSPEIVPGHEEQQVGDYLLNLFLRQLPEPERKELIFCAAPRFLDIASLRVILQLPTDVEARERWNRYRRLTFMSAIDDHRIVFHPLVRVLLLRQLPPGHEPESDYYRTHTRLREHFHRLASTQPSSMQQGMGDWQVHLEEAYHALALGDPEPAIKLGIDAQHATLAVWEPLLEAVTQAPTAPTALMPANREKPAYDALVQAERHHYTQDGVTAIILYRWLLTASQSVPWKNARLQHNLGIAHSALPAGDRDANLKRAITCYEAALQVYTREAFPP